MVAHGRAPNGIPLKLKRSKLVNGQYKNAHMAGTDAVFSPPKSASILGLVGGDKRIEEAHQLAAEKTLKMIERDCTVARVRTGGRQIKENTQNLIAAARLTIGNPGQMMTGFPCHRSTDIPSYLDPQNAEMGNGDGWTMSNSISIRSTDSARFTSRI